MINDILFILHRRSFYLYFQVPPCQWINQFIKMFFLFMRIILSLKYDLSIKPHND